MGGLSGKIGKTINKVTRFHDKIDPIGKKVRDPIEDALGVPRSADIGDSLSPQATASEMRTYTPPGTPTIDEARQASEEEDRQRKKRGRASTILTGQRGDTSTVNVGTKTLLGG